MAKGWYAASGVVLSFLAAWLVLTPVVIWVYRYVAPGRPEWLATVLVGTFTAANLSGFLHGFVLFWVDGMLGYTVGAGLRWMPMLVSAALWPWVTQLMTRVHNRYRTA